MANLDSAVSRTNPGRLELDHQGLPSIMCSRDADRSGVQFIKMDEEELNQGLRKLAERTLPELPKTLKPVVLEAVRTESSSSRERWVDGFVPILQRPLWAALALLITIGIGATFGRTFADVDARMAQSLLGLNVFSGDAPDLPSTLLTLPR
jgi:hypothetical protein